MSALRYIGERIRKIHKWDKDIATKDWVEQNVYLNSDASPKSGYVDLSVTPHLVELFDDFDRPEVSDIAVESASQNAKTLYLMSLNAKIQCTEPCPIQWMTPTKDAIAKYISEKVEPFNKGVKTYIEKLEDFKADEGIRGKREIKKVAGGSTVYTGTTRTERKSLTIKVWIGDEVAEFPKGSVTEATERTKTYEKFFPKRIAASTIESPEDELHQMAKSCTAIKEFQYICKKCKKTFWAGNKTLKYITKADYLKLKNVNESKYNKEDHKDMAKKSGHVECPHCKHKITNDEKDKMVKESSKIVNGTRVMTGKGMKFVYIKGGPKDTKIHARMNSLVSWFVSFGTIIEKLIDAEDDEVELDKVYRGWFSEFYDSQEKNTNDNEILLLGNALPEWIIPEDTFKIYMGVDTQKDHFWYKIMAYCYGNVAHVVSAGRVETFDQLETLFSALYCDKNGREYIVDRLGIDRQGIPERTNEVDAWVIKMTKYYGIGMGDEPRIFLSMGFAELPANRSHMVYDHVRDIGGYRDKEPIKAIKISNLYLKNTLYSQINRTIMKEKGDEEAQDFVKKLFYINQDIVDNAAPAGESISTDYERQMTAEEYIKKRNKQGKLADKETWENPHQRDNHLWDCAVICTAFAEMDFINNVEKPSDISVSDMLDSIYNS